MDSARDLAELGCATLPTSLPADLLATLHEQVFAPDTAGTRCLLDVLAVQQTAALLRPELAATVQRHGESTCLAHPGDALLMKPLLLYASSPAATPRHRRVLHIVYHAAPPPLEPWHRSA